MAINQGSCPLSPSPLSPSPLSPSLLPASQLMFLFLTIPSTPCFPALILFIWASFLIGYTKHGARVRGAQDPNHLQHHLSGKRSLDHSKQPNCRVCVEITHQLPPASLGLLHWSSSQYFIFVASDIFPKNQFDYSENSKDPVNGELNNFFIL